MPRGNPANRISPAGNILLHMPHPLSPLVGVIQCRQPESSRETFGHSLLFHCMHTVLSTMKELMRTGDPFIPPINSKDRNIAVPASSFGSKTAPGSGVCPYSTHRSGAYSEETCHTTGVRLICSPSQSRAIRWNISASPLQKNWWIGLSSPLASWPLS
ncbi:hypothetical protein D3C75_1046470 [compost metagenome]